jgi:hypothetical protein
MHTHHAAKQKFLGPASSDDPDDLVSHVQGFIASAASAPAAVPYTVDTHLRQTTAPHGMSVPEVRRLFDSVHYMMKPGRMLALATLAGPLKAMPCGAVRDVVAAFLKALGKKQKKFGLPQYYVMVWECAGGLHTHVVFVANPRMLDELKELQRFAPYLDVRRAWWPGGLPIYLSKERTGWAQIQLGAFIRGGRKDGAHRLPGGGDRVRLSSALKEDAIAAGYVTQWKPTNAKRKPLEARASGRPYRIRSGRAPRPTPTQLPMFPELEKPPVRLRDFHGGIPTPAQAQELEFRRKRLGLSQRQLAARCGISQAHWANVVRGHDSMSRFAARQIREALLGADALEAA